MLLERQQSPSWGGLSKIGEDRNLGRIGRAPADTFNSLSCGSADEANDLAAVGGGKMSPGGYVCVTHIVGIPRCGVFSARAEDESRRGGDNDRNRTKSHET